MLVSCVVVLDGGTSFTIESQRHIQARLPIRAKHNRDSPGLCWRDRITARRHSIRAALHIDKPHRLAPRLKNQVSQMNTVIVRHGRRHLHMLHRQQASSNVPIW